MKNNTKSVMIILLGIFLIGFISATVTLVSPSSSVRQVGTIALNATNSSKFGLMDNCTYYVKSASSNHTGWFEIANSSNYTTYASAGKLTDAEDWIFNASCTNNSNSIESGTTTGIAIDNDVPTATWGSSNIADNYNLLSQSTFTFAVTADATSGISNCTILMNGVSKTTTANSHACSTTYTPESFSITTAGTYPYSFLATDFNSNETNVSTARTLDVDITVGGGGGGMIGSSVVDDADEDEGVEAGAGISNKITHFITTIIDWFKNLFT